tara:strand:- start:13 stop:282 length:270 start_codon:yes stop_codon:yes gene_type:complete
MIKEYDYEVLDIGNIESLKNKLKLAQDKIDEFSIELNSLYNDHETLKIKFNSLNIRHTILKAQKNYSSSKVSTNTKMVDGRLVTTTKII